MWVPVVRAWQLNERHYGGLQGLNKSETAKKFGEDQVKVWRRSYDIPPPPLDADDPSHPRFERRYAQLDPVVLPATESLKITLERVMPYWANRHRPAPEARRDGPDRRPRQQPARTGQAPEQDLG